MRRRPNADLEFIRRVIRAITGGIDLDFRPPLPKQLPRVLSLPPPQEKPIDRLVNTTIAFIKERVRRSDDE
jgi:hypothetical protein